MYDENFIRFIIFAIRFLIFPVYKKHQDDGKKLWDVNLEHFPTIWDNHTVVLKFQFKMTRKCRIQTEKVKQLLNCTAYLLIEVVLKLLPQAFRSCVGVCQNASIQQQNRVAKEVRPFPLSTDCFLVRWTLLRHQHSIVAGCKQKKVWR